MACKNGYIDIVKLLLSKNCNVDAVTKVNHFARFILINNTNNKLEENPIHLACLHGYTDIVKLLISKGCDIEAEFRVSRLQNINILDYFQLKKRPIHLACLYGHIDIVKLLLIENCNAEAETEAIPVYGFC